MCFIRNNLRFLLLAIYSSFDFQTLVKPFMEGIIHFHHDLMFLLTFICFFVLWMLLRTVQLFSYSNNKTYIPVTRSMFSFNYFKHQGILLEIIWTLVPALILMFVAIPSFALLYSTSAFCTADVTLRAIGHQWYWTYELYWLLEHADSGYVEYEEPEFSVDAYMIQEDISKKNKVIPRNLCTDKLIPLPTQMYIRLLLTSDDVLHSWTVPCFGVKVDACPGRLNSVNFIINREGLFFGACSEICGVNHGFMPIVVKGVSADTFVTWIAAKLDNLVVD